MLFGRGGAAPPRATGAVSGQRIDLARSLRLNLALILISAIYVAIGAVALAAYGLPQVRPAAYLTNFILFASAAILIIGPAILFRITRDRPGHPVEYSLRILSEWRLRERMLLAAPVVAALTFFMPTFSALKSAIPVFATYSWDPALADFDAAIHGGDAWRLIQPLVGYPIVSFLLNGIYHLWLALLYLGVLLIAGWVERPGIRTQFFATYLLSWALIGTISAIAFASVGPCFYEASYGNARFAPLMDYLAVADWSYPLMALDVQRQLAEWHFSNSNGLGRGISAMPSMHISVATIFTLCCWRLSRTAGLICSAFLASLLLGSVHLGYHYAIDGYASIVATSVIWWVCGLALRRRRGTSAS